MSLHLTLLGSLTLTLGGEPLTGFASNKSPALLAYLALQPGIHARPALASLLWGELPEDRALHNLRTALNDLRKKIPQHLLITRANVALHPDAPMTTDALEYQHLAASPDPADLQQAMALYRGDFLAGVQLKEAPDFDDWLTLQRERLRALALNVLHMLTTHHAEAGDYRQGIETARRMLALEPWREEAHRQLMLLLARDGQYSAALHQYETCRQILTDELSVAPMRETTALYERIRAARRGRGYLPPSAPTSHHNLPAPRMYPSAFAPFVGRASELAAITARLANPACRLLTLTGLGGSGKTRLALQTAHTAPHRFLNGVFFVPLAGIEPSYFLPAVAQSLALPFRENENPQTQLLDYLAPKKLLLILDNFEHLLPTATSDGGGRMAVYPPSSSALTAPIRLLPEILRAAQDVKILVTSRERLNLHAEWVLDISGMDTRMYPLPVPRGRPSARPASDDPLQLDAVQFFLSCAQQRGAAAFSSTEALSQILSIVQKVGGLPLAIELAAAWVPSLSLAEIETELSPENFRRSLDFLASSLRDTPEPQRSIRVVLEGSWRLLAAAERDTLRRLAVFAGGFSADAAAQIADAHPSLLRALTDKSLVQHTGERCTLHPLTHQFLREKLADAPDELTRVTARHGRFFAAFLHIRERELAGERHIEALNEIAAEIENVRAAWNWAVNTVDIPTLEKALESLMHFYQVRVWWEEAEEALTRASTVVEGTGERGAFMGHLHLWRARFFISQSRFAEAQTFMQALLDGAPSPGIAAQAAGVLAEALFRTGETGEAETRARQSLVLCQHLEDAGGIAAALSLLGQIANRNGDYTASENNLRQSVDMYQALGNARAVDSTLRLLGAVAYARGEFADFSEDRIEAARKSGSPARLGAAFNHAGAINYARGNYPAAERYFAESLELAREIGYPTLIAFNLNDLGYMRHLASDHATARRMFEEALEIYQRTGEKWGIARSLNNLGMVLNAVGELKQAKALQLQSIAMREEMNDPRGLAHSLNDLGKVYLAEGNWHRAREVCNRALKIFETIGNKEGIVHAHLLSGKIAQSEGKVGEAEKAFRAALELATIIKAEALVQEAWTGMKQLS